MVDFTGFGPIAGVRTAHELAPLPRPNVPNTVAAPDGTDKTRTETGREGSSFAGARHDGTGRGGGTRHPAAQGPASAADTPAAAPDRPLREDMLAGPPPAFEASLLEIETDLRLALARVQTMGYGRTSAEPAPRTAERGQEASVMETEDGSRPTHPPDATARDRSQDRDGQR